MIRAEIVVFPVPPFPATAIVLVKIPLHANLAAW
jgi:hypothetical protein